MLCLRDCRNANDLVQLFKFSETLVGKGEGIKFDFLSTVSEIRVNIYRSDHRLGDSPFLSPLFYIFPPVSLRISSEVQEIY